MTRFDVARTQQPKSTAACGSLRFGPLRYQLERKIGMLPTPDNSECSRHIRAQLRARPAAPDPARRSGPRFCCHSGLEGLTTYRYVLTGTNKIRKGRQSRITPRSH
ncbi:hypothetical protein [Tateyamaria sp.]|uniref:hypothetical protein n=1 Tax=Tateyamaria sp. TaxID=1929288 RepID=UPI003B210FE7